MQPWLPHHLYDSALSKLLSFCQVASWKPHHVALKRHPVAHRALVFGLTGLGVLGSDQGAAAVVAVDLPDALGRGVLARLARDKVGLPNDISALVIVARVLFGQVDVDIRLPVGLSLCGKGVGLLGVLDLDFAGLLVVNGVLDLLGERAAVDGPTKVAAFDGALLATARVHQRVEPTVLSRWRVRLPSC